MSAISYDGQSAFPCPNTTSAVNAKGMELRDYFAAHALIAIGQHKAVTARGIEWLVQHAYMIADGMMTEREQ